MPVTLRANCIGSLAAEALTNGDTEIIARVLNTFANSFYMRTVNSELVFVTSRSLQSPVTINLDSAYSLDQLVKPTDPVLAHGKGIQIGSGASIDLTTASPYPSERILARQLGPVFSKLQQALRIISFILGITDTSQSVLDQHSLAHEGVAQFVYDGVLPLRHSSIEGRFKDAAFRIVGLGSGFTPSGDDALGGFLAAYNSLAPTIGRSRISLPFVSLETKTSWISAKLLDYMQRLILDDQIYRVIDSAAEGNQDALVLALETLLPRGHTSGIDISAGVVLALSLIRDVAFEEEETESIANMLGLSL